MSTLLGKSEAARLLNCSITTIDRLRARGELKSLKVGDVIKFREEDINAYITQRIEAEAQIMTVSV